MQKLQTYGNSVKANFITGSLNGSLRSNNQLVHSKSTQFYHCQAQVSFQIEIEYSLLSRSSSKNSEGCMMLINILLHLTIIKKPLNEYELGD